MSEMSQISIDLEIDIRRCLRRKSIYLETKLNDDYIVAIIIYQESAFGSYVLDSIEIHRKNTTGNISISGELGIEQYDRKIWGKKFSETIKSGFSYTRIYNRNFDKLITCKTKCRLHGFLNIPNDSEVYANVGEFEGFNSIGESRNRRSRIEELEIGDSEDKIQLKFEKALAKEKFKEKIQHKPSEDILKEEPKKREQLQSPEELENVDSKEKILLKSPEELLNEESKARIKLKFLENLSNDFKRLLEPMGSRFADVTLKCGGVSIPAHKSILSARSPVFSAMFVNPKKENTKSEVYITGIDVSILRALLIYMYTGEISDLTVSLAANLLFAATYYRLQELVRVCFHFLKDSVPPRTMFRVLFQRDMFDGDLKSLAVDYTFDKLAEFYIFYESEEGKTLRNEKPTMFWDVFESLKERF